MNQTWDKAYARDLSITYFYNKKRNQATHTQ